MNNFNRVLLFIIIFFSIFCLFGDDFDEDKYVGDISILYYRSNIIAREITYEYINKDIIFSIDFYGDMTNMTLMIYFNSGVYELNENINEIIGNILLDKLKENMSINNIGIVTVYPYSIILVNDNNYTTEERQIIKNEIFVYGVTINHIFKNAIYGYFYDKYFGHLSERNNERIVNSFNQFIQNIIEYFGIGNTITF
jgi:hypothetical protein